MIVSPEEINANSAPSARPLKTWDTKFAQLIMFLAALQDINPTLYEAASIDGANGWHQFWKITIPLSKNGIVAGCMLVFIPVVGEFVIPELLGGPGTLMIGRQLWSEFFSAGNWPMASAVAITMLALLLVPIVVFHRFQQRELEGRLA